MLLYKLILYLFQYKVKNKIDYIIYTVKYKLKYIDIRKLARFEQALKLKTANLVEFNNDKSEVVIKNNFIERKNVFNEGFQNIIEIFYKEIMKFLNEVVWS